MQCITAVIVRIWIIKFSCLRSERVSDPNVFYERVLCVLLRLRQLISLRQLITTVDYDSWLRQLLTGWPRSQLLRALSPETYFVIGFNHCLPGRCFDYSNGYVGVIGSYLAWRYSFLCKTPMPPSPTPTFSTNAGCFPEVRPVDEMKHRSLPRFQIRVVNRAAKDAVYQ